MWPSGPGSALGWSRLRRAPPTPTRSCEWIVSTWRRQSSLARIHRRTRMDGVRTAEGGEGVTGAMAWGLGVDGRPADGLQAPHRAPKALCGSCDARDRTRQEALADWAGASLRGRWVGWWVSGGRAPSGWEWNGSQSGQGAAELLLPGPAPGKMQGQSACRAGDPSAKAKTRRLRVLVVTIC